MTSDVVIVGGGVIGLTIARELAQASLRVLLVDRQAPGREASWAGAGILPPAALTGPDDPLTRWTAESHPLWPELSAELHAATGIDNGFRRCGGLQLASGASTAPELTFRPSGDESLDSLLASWRRAGAVAEQVAGCALYELEPALADRAAAAVWLPNVCQVRNPRHLQALIADCRQRGVQLQSDVAVQDVWRQGGRACGVRTAAGTIAAAAVVIAAGAWSTQLLPAGAVPLTIEPVRGQMLLLRQPAATLRRVVECGRRYLVPRDDGRVLVGSTEERAGYDRSTSAAVLDDLQRFAVELAPGLASAERESAWAGLRPHALTGRPWIGPVPGTAGLYLAAGHFRSGLHLSPITARMIRQAITGQ